MLLFEYQMFNCHHIIEGVHVFIPLLVVIVYITHQDRNLKLDVDWLYSDGTLGTLVWWIIL